MSSHGSHENSPPRGHLFVVRGKIGHLVADAAIIPTDHDFRVEKFWHDILGASSAQDARDHRPPEWADQGWGPSAKPETVGVWFLDVTARRGGGDDDQFARLAALLSAVAAAKLVPKAKGRPVPLVVLPVIGTAGGGFGHKRGEVIRRLVEVCQTFLAHHALDVAIVSASPAP